MATSFSAPPGIASSATTETGIVGGNSSPYSSTYLANPTDYLSTGDLQAGDPGDFGGLGQFTIEGIFRPGNVGTYLDSNMIYGPLSSSGALRQWYLTLLSSGLIKLDVTDESGGTTSLTTGTPLVLNRWYHVVATAEAGAVKLYINGGAQGALGSWGSHTVRPIGTTAGQLDVRLPGALVAGAIFYWDELGLYNTPLSSARVLEHYNAMANRGFSMQFSGARINAILDAISSTAPRSIQSGASQVIPRYMSGQSPLEEIRRAVEADDVDAAFFVSKSGTLTFLADGHRASAPYNTPKAVFGDVGSGEALKYADITLDYSPTNLINEWNVTRSNYGVALPSTKTVADATSIARYKKRSQSLSDVPVIADSVALGIATRLLAKTKDPMLRITSVTLLLNDLAVAAAALSLELMDMITIKRKPPGGGATISQNLWIQSRRVKGTPSGPVSVTFGVSPL